MSGTFNGYHVWLGIPPSEQPPNHYRLLGIAVFETDLDVIDHAADRQMAHVRTFQSGKHGAMSQQILNELSVARLCLLNAEKKTSYDQELRSKIVVVPKAAPAVPVARPVPMAQPIAAPLVKPVTASGVTPISTAVPAGSSGIASPTDSHILSGAPPQAHDIGTTKISGQSSVVGAGDSNVIGSVPVARQVNPAGRSGVNPASKSGVNPAGRSGVNPAGKSGINPAGRSGIMPPGGSGVGQAGKSGVQSKSAPSVAAPMMPPTSRPAPAANAGTSGTHAPIAAPVMLTPSGQPSVGNKPRQSPLPTNDEEEEEVVDLADVEPHVPELDDLDASPSFEPQYVRRLRLSNNWRKPLMTGVLAALAAITLISAYYGIKWLVTSEEVRKAILGDPDAVPTSPATPRYNPDAPAAPAPESRPEGTSGQTSANQRVAPQDSATCRFRFDIFSTAASLAPERGGDV